MQLPAPRTRARAQGAKAEAPARPRTWKARWLELTVVTAAIAVAAVCLAKAWTAPLELAPACERAAGPDREWTPRKVAGDKVREEDLVEVARALAAVGALRVVSGTR